ncbi:glycosyltransferase family 2 protein [Ectobacillus sp. sgz5001026]|uniref:glycosyltransferase family 2 protein n=1 Tax=Ectobacillus sp. sgz5001026 TaxID=3242473 RepID=UPI0036D42E68
MNNSILTVVVPCYNEEEVLSETTKRLSQLLDEMKKDGLVSEKSNILYVDDGSKDTTWKIIEAYTKENASITGLKLSRNFGHQGALLAGLETAYQYADCVVSIDADLQDDIQAIREFIIKFNEGYEVVYGVRDKRDTDTPFKRRTALAFYGFMGKMGVKLVPNHADFRLLSKRALGEFLQFREENMFIRGIIPLLGFKSTNVFYNRAERFAGESKYPLKKMINFALDGITSFSIVPIRFVAIMGFIVTFISILMGIYALVQRLVGDVVSGWSSIILSIWFIGGVQLLAMGVIGEYIGKIFKETKRRPRFTIEMDLYSLQMTEGKESPYSEVHRYKETVK